MLMKIAAVPRPVQLRRLHAAAYLPVPKFFKDVGVSFGSMKLQKFRYCCIELRSLFRLSSLLTHGQPSVLKRRNPAVLLVSHGAPAASATVLATRLRRKKSDITSFIYRPLTAVGAETLGGTTIAA